MFRYDQFHEERKKIPQIIYDCNFPTVNVFSEGDRTGS